MNIAVIYEGKLITYPDLSDNIDAEEYVARFYPFIKEIPWGEYEEEEVIYDDGKAGKDSFSMTVTKAKYKYKVVDKELELDKDSE